ncbi:hemolysin family protein [Oceaniovalibus guishaninsula]|nr:hemolysin family protein [Oceaniovalibus guishaninsula]
MTEGELGAARAEGGQPPNDAQDDAEGDSPERGFFGRIMNALIPPDGNGDQPAQPGDHPMPRMPPGLLNLRRMRVEDVAIPTVEIVAVPVDISKDDLVAVFRDSGMTRLPVYDGTLDHPVGMAHLKDFALRHGFGPAPGTEEEPFDLRAIMRPLIYCPPSMPIGVLLQRMQTERTHMALVIDEYGGVDGLLTIEDLIEQVIGQIEDEHDTDEDKFWTEEKAGVYLAQAKTPLDEFEAEIGMRLTDPDDDEEIDTLGGVIVVMTGRVPTRGEVIPHPAGPEFEIVDADPRRLKRLRVRMPQTAGG